MFPNAAKCLPVLAVVVVFAHVAEAGVLPAPTSLVPQAAKVEVVEGRFILGPGTDIIADLRDSEHRRIAEYLADELERRLGARPRVHEPYGGLSPTNAITLGVNSHAALGREGYQLEMWPSYMNLSAETPAGLFYAVQSLLQLVDDHERSGSEVGLPCVRIEDRPRYRWRGMLLDCGRHFMDKEFVKRYIDLLAYHKMNVLHWHLTEDQGWRIEIKKYPKLTEIGAWRGAGQDWYGGFYSQDDIREIVEYARSRYVTIVPEIEMPGHCVAALAAYPELSCTGGPFEVSTRWGVHGEVYCAGNDEVFTFLEDVLSEVIELFPSEFIHIGGDECPKERWKQCPKCQARIKAEGLRDEHELQSYFVRRIEKFLNSHGRRLVGWDEILEGGLAPNATVQSWRGMDGALAAARAGHDVVSSPTSHCYLDYAQVRTAGEPTWMGYIPLERCYAFEPTPTELTPEEAKHVLGLEGNMWTEHAPQERVDWQVFPRLCALAEVAWSPKERRNWEDFQTRMQEHYRRLDALGVTYFIPPPTCTASELVFTDAVEITLENPFKRGKVRYTLDGSEPEQDSRVYDGPIRLTDSAALRACTFVDVGRQSAVAEYHFRKLRPLEAVVAADAVPGLTYAYYEGEWARLPEFSELTPTVTGTCATFDVGVRRRDSRFALDFSGYLTAPADGVYTFFLASDDGSRLYIGSELVVDHDGLHAANEKSGQVILKAGKHPIRVTYFQAGGALGLEVGYAGPGLTRQPIPPTAVWRSAASNDRP